LKSSGDKELEKLKVEQAKKKKNNRNQKNLR
jgi:hypothetical protein